MRGTITLGAVVVSWEGDDALSRGKVRVGDPLDPSNEDYYYTEALREMLGDPDGYYEKCPGEPVYPTTSWAGLYSFTEWYCTTYGRDFFHVGPPIPPSTSGDIVH